MRIVYLIDCLGSGGAQRQLVLLARAMQQRGHDSLVLTYREGSFFGAELDAEMVNRRCLGCAGPLNTLRMLRGELARAQPDAVVAFLENPALYAEIASIGRNWRLIVSERSNDPAFEARAFTKVRRWLHLFAHAVTTNSHTNRRAIERACPLLEGRVHTIYNGVELERFRPLHISRNEAEVRFVVFASHKEEKNFAGLARGLVKFKERNAGLSIQVDWYGDNGTPDGLARDLGVRAQAGIERIVRFFPPVDTAEVVRQMHASDAVLLPSLWEGLPNAVCEAMAAGRPVLMSDVCDARHLIADGRTGLLFDPTSPSSIANALERFVHLSASERQTMGAAARTRAEAMFSVDEFAAAYEEIIEGRPNNAVAA